MKKLVSFLTIALVVLLVSVLVACNQAPAAQTPAELPVSVTEPTVVEEVTEPVTEPEPTEPPFIANATADSDPANWNTVWEIYENGELTDHYNREEPIFFEDDDYFALPGVSSFRGGNYRQDASYGTAEITDGTITDLWMMAVGALGDSSYGGCCWTGQPLVVQWDAETRAIMNLYDDKKEKDGLTEVIYAKADGYVHFIDLEDGSYTRDPLFVGMAFKGSGALDPRGYPILYLGSGLISGGKIQRMYAISLIDGSILYERGGDESIANRYWFGFDGAPLVDAETDTLIWGGESGVLYTIKLNTQYDKAAGTLTMAPEEPVMTCYKDSYTTLGRNNGYESSVTAVENYLYVGNNAGLMQCIDINTMELVWAQDIKDDINATPVFEWGADGNGYIYTAPSMDYSGYLSNLPLCKLDARTGQILWTHEMTCGTMDGVPGGVLATPVLGKAGSDIENLIIHAVGCSPNARYGQVVALDKETGEVVWQFQTSHYMWSSPVALYTDAGKSYIFQVDSRGVCYLLDGATGEQLDRLEIGTTVEASPVVFNNRIVLGTRFRIHILEIA